MKLRFKYYIVLWLVLIAVYNVIVFITPNEINGMSKFTASFWVGYIFIMLIFIGQLVVAWLAIKDDKATKLFYKIPLISISLVTLVLMVVVGTLCMAIPNFPIWLGVILCLLVFAFSITALIQAQMASSIVIDIDTKVKEKTSFIKLLTVDIESLIARATTTEIKNELNRVYDAVRYSDPMSNDALLGTESQITLKVSELTDGVEKGDINIVTKVVKEIIVFLNDRNKKCKLLK